LPLLPTPPHSSPLSSRRSEEDNAHASQRPEMQGHGRQEGAGASSWPSAVDVKLEVAKDETIACGNEEERLPRR
jgi:hypothetical protein